MTTGTNTGCGVQGQAKRMRIVQVSVGSVRMPPKEGSAPLQVIFNTSKQLAKMGQEVIILDRKYSKHDPAIEQIEGVQVTRLKALQLPAVRKPSFIRFVLAELNALIFALTVSNYLRKNGSRIDVIHLHLTSVGLVVSILNRNLRGKMFYTCHLGEWQMTRARMGVFERLNLFLDPYLMRRVKKVIALNFSARDSFISVGKVNPDNVAVLPNGVDINLFNPDVEGKNNAIKKYVLGGRLVVLFVGRLARIKGVEHLIRAADKLVNDFGCRDVLFVLVGPSAFDATEKPIRMGKLLSYIKEHNLDKNVLLTGSLMLEEVRSLYAACDIFVLPSLTESGPIVTLEAMACGKPIIATRVGDTTHQIREGWNGFLIERGNEKQIAEKIKYLIDNPEERKRMGENSRKYAVEEFDWSKIAGRLAEAYRS